MPLILDGRNHPEKAIVKAVNCLSAALPVIVPTETVYGLAGDATSDAAIEAIYAAKNRPSNNPLISHVASLAMAKRYASFCPLAEQLAHHFWPGPLSMVLPAKNDNGLSAKVTAGQTSIAIRCPDMPIFRALIERFDKPLAAPSANPSGKISPSTVEQAAEGLAGKVSLAIDAGPARIGVESTILSVFDGQLTILRPGSITAEDIEAACSVKPLSPHIETANPTAPGQLPSHYAPDKPVYLNILAPQPGHIYIGFGAARNADIQLSAGADLAEAGRNLYAALRQANAHAAPAIDIAPIPHKGVGIAINDRLRRAAAPKPKGGSTQ